MQATDLAFDVPSIFVLNGGDRLCDHAPTVESNSAQIFATEADLTEDRIQLLAFLCWTLQEYRDLRHHYNQIGG